jgi:hypothetical protein
MRDFVDSTLWRVSAFERVQQQTGTTGFSRLEDGPTLLPTTLLTDLQRLDDDPLSGDVLEVAAACMRHRSAALLYLQYAEYVWPVTIFPIEGVYHSPRDMIEASAAGLASLKVLSAEPPGVRPPGHNRHERVTHEDQYRPLDPLLWMLAMSGPRKTLLREIGGTAAYGLGPSSARLARLSVPGALGSAVERLRRESASLRDIAGWPGLSVERASRLLNGLYLARSLRVVRTHPSARSEPGFVRSLLGRGKARR